MTPEQRNHWQSEASEWEHRSQKFTAKKWPFQAILSIVTHWTEGPHFHAYPDDFGPSPFSSSVKGRQWGCSISSAQLSGIPLILWESKHPVSTLSPPLLLQNENNDADTFCLPTEPWQHLSHREPVLTPALNYCPRSHLDALMAHQGTAAELQPAAWAISSRKQWTGY